MVKRKMIFVKMETEQIEDLQRRADSMDISITKYCTTIFMRHIESGERIEITEG